MTVMDAGTRPVARKGIRRAVRLGWAASAVFWGAFAVLEAVNHGVAAGLFAVAFFIAPDLTFLVAVRDAHAARPGQLPARAVPYYNAAHRALVPVVLMVVCVVTPHSWAPLFAGLCGWTAHISLDRALGYGLRTKEGLQRD
ncbi:DUF4260 family protein [Streptomyces sp. NPDC092952]|uniref:DUF4260 family protein n=1 Tax=Streptomyces sp. NPDC092952 TaxID=3366018 RepID=UPI00380C6441